MSRPFLIFSFTLFICFWRIDLAAQTDTVLALPKVEVLGKNLRNHALAERIENWDSLALGDFHHGNIGEILSQQSGVFVKNFGPGSLATMSVRGSSAGQTAIVWNGLPIQSPMLGLLDISLLPTDLTDATTLHLGGNSSLWGSGAIGGILSLENKPVFSSPLQFQIGTTLGNFGRFDQSLKVEWGGKKTGHSTTLLHQDSENDFPYLLSTGEEKQQTNAAKKQLDFLHEFYWKLNSRNQFSAHIWWQNAKREIPPTVTQNKSEATQADAAKRVALHWNRFGEKTIWKSKIGFFHEEIDYQDPQIFLEAISHFWSLIGDLEGNFQITPSSHFSIGLTQMLTRAFANEYGSPPTESQTSVFVSANHQFGKTKTQASLRQSLINEKVVGLTPSFSVSRPFGSRLSGWVKVTRNYRLPTLNDRFWRPGGNPDLLAEEGWSQEVGSHLNWHLGRGQFEYEWTVFNRNIDNWILWSPEEHAFYWSAKNLTKVWSRGIEQRFNFSHKADKMKWRFSTGYDFIKSTNEKTISTPKLEKGEQLIYTPVHQFFGGITIGLGRWNISYHHQIVGEFTAPNEQLEGYHLGNVHLNMTVLSKFFSGTFFFRLKNAWDENYRVVERRPMPRRHFSLGFNLKFSKQKNNTLKVNLKNHQ